MQWPGNHRGLYQPENAKDSCGFGLIAHIKGEASHHLVSTACTALDRMTHRGAVAVDGKTGDGCGVLMAMPESFFRTVCAEEGIWLGENFAVGMVFLGRDEAVAAASRARLEKHLAHEMLEVSGWREVPVDESVLGQLSSNTRVFQRSFKGTSAWIAPLYSNNAGDSMPYAISPRPGSAPMSNPSSTTCRAVCLRRSW